MFTPNVYTQCLQHEMDQIGNSFGQLATIFKTKVLKTNSSELAAATENAGLD